MSLPIVAVVGRPNVGKSTFVNRIAQTHEAIVHEQRGVTRDRSYHRAEWNGVCFTLVDTGGIEMAADDVFQTPIRNQAIMATEEADAIIFLVDGSCGATGDDQAVAKLLKRSARPVILAVNKLDDPGREDAIWDYYSLGLGDPMPISSVHGHGTGDLLDVLVELLPSSADGEDDEVEAINVAIIGRPNAGKSSLTNRLTGFERSIVSDVAGTTRDSIDALVYRNKSANGGSDIQTKIQTEAQVETQFEVQTEVQVEVQTEVQVESQVEAPSVYRIIDTAGLRRKSQMNEDVEYYGFVRAMRAIDRADVALLVVDATIGLTDADQRIATFADDRGCALIILLNKWDLLDDPEEREKLREQVKDRMVFVSYAQVIAISAKTGRSVHRIWDAIDKAYQNYSRSIATSQLNNLLSELRDFGHTVTRGKMRLRINYITQTGVCPPFFTLFANHPQIIDDGYQRYLENRMREAFPLDGTPIRMKFKKKDL